MNPKMKNSAVTVMNGTRYPGEVSAADGVDRVVIGGYSPLPESVLPGKVIFVAPGVGGSITVGSLKPATALRFSQSLRPFCRTEHYT
jgi:hypothetical protein